MRVYTLRMAQLILELDDETAEKLRLAAEREGLTQSQWLARLLGRAERWPQAVRELAGAWPDLPDADVLRRELDDDAPREPL